MHVPVHLMDRGCIWCEVGDEGMASLVVCGDAEILLVSNSTLPVLAEDVLVVRILEVCIKEGYRNIAVKSLKSLFTFELCLIGLGSTNCADTLSGTCRRVWPPQSL